MNRQRILEEWNDFRKVLPADAGENQVIETRRAFYAGAAVAYKIMMEASALNEGAAEQMLQDMKDELEHWVTRLRGGGV